MENNQNWQEEKYRHVYEQELRGLCRRRDHDKNLCVKEIEGILKNLYISEGNDQEGRGAVGDIVCSATIAAHEFFIADWKKNLSQQ
ncbi:MAG: hypothetical protein ACRC4W_01360 [Treponemataceae bacterium]